MSTWERLRRASTLTGRAAASAAKWVGRNAASAYQAVDPDLRKHLAQLPVMGLTMLAPGDQVPEPLPDDGARPIIFVKGLGGAPGNFLPLRLFLRFHGRRRTYAVSDSSATSLEEAAVRLTAFVHQVCAVNELPDDATVDLVAHSMGGLTARLALEDPATRRRVATLVTIATPHLGSHLARYGAFPRSMSLRPDSDTLARLGQQLPWRGPPEQPRLVSLWSPGDVVLLPATSACAPGAENVELDGFTHYSYLIHPDGWRAVLAALG